MTTTSQSTGELLRQAADQMATLVRDEIRLVQLDLADKARHASRGAGFFAGAGLAAAYGVGALVVAAGLGLALVLPGWAAALSVGGFLLLGAAFMVLLGRWQLRRATSVNTRSAMRHLRADVAVVSGRPTSRSDR